MSSPAGSIRSFNLRPGRVIGGKYVVETRLGGGWEGEVYKVAEQRTGIHRAIKLFFPQRNVGDRAVTIYAKKLDRLRHCPLVIQYHHSESIRFRGQRITCLVSDFVEGALLDQFVAACPGGALGPFEALHLLHALVVGIEEIHLAGEYHGDLHEGNVMVARRGIYFDVRLVDFYHWGRTTARHRRDDVADAVRLLYEAVGGRARYRDQPPEIKAICKGLRRDLVIRAFPTAAVLRAHLESFTWAPGRAPRAAARPR